MDVLMPQMGETVAEGTLTVWHKKVGDTVGSSDILFEIGTDKVEMEVPALMDGVLTEILVQAGETVAVGATLAVITGKGEAAATPAPAAAAPAQAPVQAPAAPLQERATRDRSMKLSPVVRKLLAENNLSHSDIVGTGRDGRLKRADVLAYLAAPKAAPSAPIPAQAPGAISGEGIKIGRAHV